MAVLAVRCVRVAVKKSQTGLTLSPCVCLCAVASQEMSVGYANGIRVMSMTHTGEPGFMLYIPIEVSLHLETGTMMLIRDNFNDDTLDLMAASSFALRSTPCTCTTR